MTLLINVLILVTSAETAKTGEVMLKKETNKRRVINAFVYFSYRPPIYKNKFLIVGRYKFKKTL